LRVFFIFGLFIISLVLQGSVLELAGTGGVHPDLLFVVVVAMGLFSDSKRGFLLGLCAGLMQDIIFATPIGFFTLGKMLAGLFAGMLSHEVYRDFVPVPVTVVSLLTLLNEAVTFFLMSFFHDSSLTFLQYVLSISFPRVIMHFLIMALVYPYLYRAQKRNLFFEPED